MDERTRRNEGGDLEPADGDGGQDVGDGSGFVARYREPAQLSGEYPHQHQAEPERRQ